MSQTIDAIQLYPRSVGRQSVFLFEGSRLTVSTKARAVYLRLPTVFATPGPRYSDFADARLRIRIDERPEATNRVMLCYEGYAPIDLIRDGQVDLLFDGHSDRPHPDSQFFPPGTLHLRAPTQETIRWIPMTRERISSEIHGADDVPVLNVPRSGPAPLRVNFAAANDGSSSEQTAVITNEYPHRFPRARIRFLVRAGRYRLEGGRTLQALQSDAGTTTVIDAEVDVQARTEITVAVRPE